MIFRKASVLAALAIFLGVAKAQVAADAFFDEDVPAVAVHQKSNSCGKFCAFRFCKADGSRTVFDNVGPRNVIRDGNVATNPFVCARKFGKKTRQINVKSTGEAMVHPVDGPADFVRISKFRKGQVKPKFSKKYFSLREITERPPLPGEFGVSRLSSKGNQEDFVDKLCVVLPITGYDVLKKNGKVSNKVRKSKASDDCISFQTTAPTILAELTWDTADDIDLRIIEPDGNVIAYFDLESPTSGAVLTLDQNVGRCGEDDTGREQVTWKRDDTPLKGRYQVQVRHFDNCGDGPTNWTLAIVINGKRVLLKSGTSNKNDDKVIKKFFFDF